MVNENSVIHDGGDADEEHEHRLLALLHDLVRRKGGRRGAARAPGIDRRTVAAACMDRPIVATESSSA